MSDGVEALLSEFSEFAYMRGGTPMFCRRTALDIINRCEQLQLEILGIDGMYLGYNASYSPIDLIYDAGHIGRRDYDGARQYIRRTADLPLFYEIVMRDPPHLHTDQSREAPHV